MLVTINRATDHNANITDRDGGRTAMRLRNLTAWWRGRKHGRDARPGFDATGEFELYTLLDEASKPSFRA
jgi:hypothetical protein